MTRIHSPRRTCFVACFLALLALPGIGLGQSGASDVVNAAELTEWFKDTQAYLIRQSARDTWRNRKVDIKSTLTGEAKEAGLTDLQFESIASFVPWRAENIIADFYEANLAPLKASAINIEALQRPVKREDFDRLKKAVEALKQYEPTLLKLRTEERKLREEQLRVLTRAFAAHAKAQALAPKYDMVFCKSCLGTNSDDRAKRAAYRAAVEETVRSLPDLHKEWQALDDKDRNLVITYVRKIFTFEIPPLYAGANKVTSLIDGETVFGRVAELLDDVAKNGKGKGYVHISLWECDIATQLTDSETFLQAIDKVRADHDEVAVALWGHGNLEHLSGMFATTEAKNQQCKAALEERGARVRLITHSDTTGANHQKTFVFFNGTETRAIVGGLNVSPSERAAAPHSDPGSWHDVAIEIAGPAVTSVEADFIVRWYAWARAAEADRIMGPGPTVASGDTEVRIGLTRSELSYTSGNLEAEQPRYTSIHDELINRIGAAQRLIYFENYAIFEESLIRAIGQRVSDRRDPQKQRLDVILLIEKDANGASPVYNWLHRVTYLHLSFMACESFQYLDADGKPIAVSRKDGGEWRVGPYEGDLYEDTMVYWSGGSTKLRDIVTFDKDVPLYIKVYRGAGQTSLRPIYVHAKVAIFDNEYAAVGSANFNARSMYQDGELTAFIHGAAAGELRQKLWIEHLSQFADGVGAPTAADWPEAVAETTKLMKGHPQMGGTYVIPLRGDDVGDFASASDKKPPLVKAENY